MNAQGNAAAAKPTFLTRAINLVMEVENINQTELAARMEESEANVSRWKLGAMPRPEKLDEVIRKLGGNLERALPYWRPRLKDAQATCATEHDQEEALPSIAMRAGSISQGGQVQWSASKEAQEANVQSIVAADKWALGDGLALLLKLENSLEYWIEGSILVARSWPEGAAPPEDKSLNAIIRWPAKWGEGDRLWRIVAHRGDVAMLPIGTVNGCEFAKLGEIEIVAIVCGVISPA